MHTLWDNCCTQFEETQFECGLRPLRPFGPGTLVARSSNVARGSKRTRFAASRLSLPNQPKDNVTPMHTLWNNCCTRFEDTQFECGSVYLTNQKIMSHLCIHFGTIVA